ncbi:YihY/virulence factor BrkB family protein [Sphaerochaeta sp. PS]|uniref:YihY/virulence factor BrkB family protein n=1 Tax=Sphaerochaeta sp. PS TaxID=3076336 RepID=UPI0028A3C460|nr:YihY/virulence factor BrkB family protein [Sphaerochaeta sp. PS]MDT4760985.1 YihY/virulence factor BrkB family protein [Sphaerochaeta sp. PS]
MSFIRAIRDRVLAFLKFATVAFNQSLRDNVMQSASSMVYSTLMALVPAVTFVFTFFSAFGVLEPIIGLLRQWLTDLVGPEAGLELMNLLNLYTTNATSLGVVGLVSFLITMVLLINKVWTVINQIFRTTRNRNALKRLASFVTFLIVACLLAAAYISIQSVVNSWYLTLIGVSIAGWSKVVGIITPIFTTWAVVFLLTYFVPNTKVRFSSAMIGSVTGTVLLMLVGKGLSLLSGMATRFSVIYGSLASVFLFLVLCYVIWIVIFFCVELAYVHQFRPDTQVYKGLPQSPALQLCEGMNIMMLIGSNFRNGGGATTTKEMMERLAIPDLRLYGFLELLSQLKFVTPTNNGHTTFIPMQPLENLKVQDLVNALYGLDTIERDERDTAGEAIAIQVQARGVSSLGNLTIENLLQRI